MSTARERFMNATKLVKAGRTGQSLVEPPATSRERFINATRLVKLGSPQTALSGGQGNSEANSAPRSPLPPYLTGGTYTPPTPYAAGLQAGIVKTPEQKEKPDKPPATIVPASTYLTGGTYTPAPSYGAGPQAGLVKTPERKEKPKPQESVPEVKAPEWVGLMDLSLDELERQHTAKIGERNGLREQIGAAEREGAGPNSSYAASAGLYDPREENPVSSSAAASGAWVSQVDKELTSLHLDADRKQAEVSDLATAYYHRRNQEALARLETDTMAKASYCSAKELSADLDAIAKALSAPTSYNSLDARFQGDGAALLRKYGATDLHTLQQTLKGQKARMVSMLEGKGYDFEDMAGYDRMLEQEKTYLAMQEKWQKDAEEHPISASGLSVIASPFQGFDYARTAGDNWGHNNADDLGSYRPLNPYDMIFTNMVQTTRGTVSRMIEENTDWELFGQNVASFIYNTGMDKLDSAFQALVFGDKAAVFLMGMSSAAETTKRVIEQGGSNEQAFWLGLTAGELEIAVNVLGAKMVSGINNAKGWSDTLKAVMTKVGVPVTKWTLTGVSNILADTATMGDRSELVEAARKYENQGLSQKEAWFQAMLDRLFQAN